MEFVQYVRLFRKWLWLILLAAFLAGGISFIVRTGQPSTYKAETILAIGRYIEAPNPNSADIRTGIDLAQTYAELVTTYDVLQGTIDNLDIPLTAERLRETINVRILSNTSLLVISVTYTDPVLAADIANGLAGQLIAKSPTNLTEDQQRQVALVNTQIEALNGQLEEQRAQLADMNRRLEAATGPEEIASLTAQRNVILDQINTATATIADFSATIATLQQRTNALDIVERARIPTQPSGSSVLSATVLGALVGATLAGGLALFIEYIDDRVRTSEQASELLSVPILGSVARFGKRRDTYPERLITRSSVPTVVAESYRSIRTNLLFLSSEDAHKVYVITSPGPVEGKSTTVANIAVSMAQAGMRVLVIDADLRRPVQHQIFGLENRVGLTTLLFADPVKSRVLARNGDAEEPTMENADLKHCVQETAIANLKVITSGFIPANPSEILGSALMVRWIDAFRQSPNIDIVLIDTPPALVVADSSVLAGTVKADVILVLDAEKTRRVGAIRAKEQFDQVGIEVQGAILNRVNPRDEDYGYGYGYGYYYQTPETVRATSPNGHGQG